eukprot:13914719-Ditylum_brightwellii.AAC.1
MSPKHYSSTRQKNPFKFYSHSSIEKLISKINDPKEDGNGIPMADLFDGVDEGIVVNDDEYNLINVDYHKVLILECNAADTNEEVESTIEIDSMQYELHFLMRLCSGFTVAMENNSNLDGNTGTEII